MRKIHPVEKEVDEIRLQIYEETKHMTPSELTEYYLKSGEETAKEYGIKMVSSAKDKT
ncbi:MAG: hypothetical protein FWG19_00955 [Methanomassiliicoccaceae archaeon]|nr:hypothetical protein [Methanomassiliicoccaceae archaeon]